MVAKVFISYRRDDIAGVAGRVSDRLAQEFGSDSLFMDVDSIPLGVNFVNALDNEVAKCDVLLAIIGRGWLDARDKDGQRRLDNQHDYVRIEVAAALKRDIPVIPILIDGAQVPNADQLPDNLKDLTLRNGLNVRHDSFHSDTARLIHSLKDLFGRSGAPPSQSKEPGGARGRTWLIGGRVAGVAALVALAWVLQSHIPGNQPTVPPIAEPTVVAQAPAATQQSPIPEPVPVPQAPAPASQAPTTNVPLPLDRERVLKPRDTFSECANCPEMLVVPAGSFTMGSPPTENGHNSDEDPQHRVTFARPFAVGKFPVTFDEWDACAADGGCDGYRPDDQGWGRGRRPVINVSWNDIKSYVAWLSKKTGKPYRLLSEAEYEYATRAGTQTRYPWGDEIGKENANCNGCGSQWDGKQTAPVGSFASNQFGLYDMIGNVREWVEDCRHDNNYDGAPSDGSAWTEACNSYGQRVLRSSSWNASPASVLPGTAFVFRPLRSASRVYSTIDLRGNRFLGFRVGRTLTP